MKHAKLIEGAYENCWGPTDNLMYEDGEPNWGALMRADPGVKKCPVCQTYVWNEARVMDVKETTDKEKLAALNLYTSIAYSGHELYIKNLALQARLGKALEALERIADRQAMPTIGELLEIARAALKDLAP